MRALILEFGRPLFDRRGHDLGQILGHEHGRIQVAT
jgi:hypothetical protein